MTRFQTILSTLSEVIQKSENRYVGIVRNPLGGGKICVHNIGGFGSNVIGSAAVGDYILHDGKVVLQSFGPVQYYSMVV